MLVVRQTPSPPRSEQRRALEARFSFLPTLSPSRHTREPLLRMELGLSADEGRESGRYELFRDVPPHATLARLRRSCQRGVGLFAFVSRAASDAQPDEPAKGALCAELIAKAVTERVR